MVKKTLKKKVMKKKVQAKPAATNIAAPVVDSAREIWLAGLFCCTERRRQDDRAG